jgi:hypothetical protein
MKLKTVLYKNGAEKIVDAAERDVFESLLADGWVDFPMKIEESAKAQKGRKKKPADTADEAKTEGDAGETNGLDETATN